MLKPQSTERKPGKWHALPWDCGRLCCESERTSGIGVGLLLVTYPARGNYPQLKYCQSSTLSIPRKEQMRKQVTDVGRIYRLPTNPQNGLTVFKDLFLFVHMCLWVGMCMCVQMLLAARRGRQIVWNWSQRQSWAGPKLGVGTESGSLEELEVLSTAKIFLQPGKYIYC